MPEYDHLDDLIDIIKSLQKRIATLESQRALPAGTITVFGGQTSLLIPLGWLECDGASYSTGTYPELFNAIGYTFGGSGANFNVPDMIRRTIRGAGGGAAIGSNDGIGTVANRDWNHNHGIPSGGSHNHPIPSASMGTANNTTTGGTATRLNSGENHDHGGLATANGAHDHGGTTNNKELPYMTARWMIKA